MLLFKLSSLLNANLLNITVEMSTLLNANLLNVTVENVDSYKKNLLNVKLNVYSSKCQLTKREHINGRN